MFVQVLEGRVSDAQSLRRQSDRWLAELAPGATGWLGTTAGIADDGRAIALVRFESEAAARANSDRREQGEWWSETEKCYDGEVRFSESTDVEAFLAGGSDDAGFVQVMKGSGISRDRLRTFDELFEQHASTWRPDLLGGYRVWTGPDSYVEVAYFTSEADARHGEQQPPPPELADHLAEFQRLMEGVEFIDLRDPIIASS